MPIIIRNAGINLGGGGSGGGGGGTGTVTSVGFSAPSIFVTSGSPITSSGTITITLASQLGNTIFAGPPTGSGIPYFRPLVISDIPNLSTLYMTPTGGYVVTNKIINAQNKIVGYIL